MPDPTCRDVIDALMDYVDDRLAPDDRAALDAHFVACPQCLAFLRSYAAVPRILRDTEPPGDVPDEVRARLMKFLAQKNRPQGGDG